MSTIQRPWRETDFDSLLPRRSLWLIAAFRRYVYWYLPRHFTAIRLDRRGFLPEALKALQPSDICLSTSCERLPDGPVVVVLNHPSWWDPLICLVLSDLFPNRVHYAPIDSASLEQYRFFGKLGFFGVQPRSVPGARVFLRTGQAILNQPRSMLWVTPQGRFVDVRDRPIRIEAGLGHLLARCPHAVVLPLALELTFWEQRLPEALARFGEPIRCDIPMSPQDWTRRIETELERNLDELAEAARSRNPEAFLILLEGRQGVSFFYDLWRKARSRIVGLFGSSRQP